MALLLREHEVERLLDMPTALEAVEEVLRQHGMGQASNQPRRRIFVPNGTLHVMSGGMPGWGMMGLKAYAAVKGKVRFVVLLFSTETGELLALIEADRLGQIRTGAASGVATKYLARADAGVVGIFGTGWQAQTQLQAVCAVRTIREVRVYGRDVERRTRFGADMEKRLGCAVRPVGSPDQAVKGSDVIITITSSKEPVFDGRLLERGQHLNVAGSNTTQKREVDDEAVRRADRIVVDQIEDAQIESGDLVGPVQRGITAWERMDELGAVVCGKAPGRARPDEITLFKSNGLAIEDVAAACKVLERAKAQGIGTQVPIFA
ncbi:MAG TPA: ornithine cyclodeaminase family protein [Candidatus Sulfotelmatobacter sp.]|nr:ornithine cyclodeaminase family protein [Candidatus Sulfotelmatobacter sp.]